MASRQRKGLSRAARQAAELQALHNAVSRESTMNYEAIIEGFAEKGVSVEDIEPRANVFTYGAWRALGRQVRKGEHGVKVVTYIQARARDDASSTAGEAGGEAKGYRFPRTTTVFHISQTDPIAPAPSQRVDQAETPSA